MADVEAIVVVEQTGPAAVEVPVPSTPAFVELVEQGPPGPPGAGGVATAFIHNQAGASDTWIINHNFGRRPVVELYTVGGVSLEGTLVHISDNQVQVLFSSAIAGFATVI